MRTIPPLAIERLSGVVRAPRLAFKLTPGDGYRLLLGDPDTAPPHYDIETLRQAVLDYAALPAQLDRLEPNRAHRSRTSDYLLHAPPTALLWGSLLLAIAVLLGITFRLLGKTPPPPEDPEVERLTQSPAKTNDYSKHAPATAATEQQLATRSRRLLPATSDSAPAGSSGYSREQRLRQGVGCETRARPQINPRGPPNQPPLAHPSKLAGA